MSLPQTVAEVIRQSDPPNLTERRDVDASACGVKRNNPLTTAVNGSVEWAAPDSNWRLLPCEGTQHPSRKACFSRGSLQFYPLDRRLQAVSCNRSLSRGKAVVPSANPVVYRIANDTSESRAGGSLPVDRPPTPTPCELRRRTARVSSVPSGSLCQN